MRRLATPMLCLLLGGCAAHYAPGSASDPYGFFSGWLHGFLLVFDAVGCMIFDGVWIVGQPNTGWPYCVGFFFGVATLVGASSSSR